MFNVARFALHVQRETCDSSDEMSKAHWVHTIFVLGSALNWCLGGAWWGQLVLFLLWQAALVYGSAYIGSGFYLNALCWLPVVGDERKRVVLSFDDGIDPEHTPAVLDELERRGIRAAFFCIGRRLEGEQAERILKRMAAAGHLIGNHTYSHHLLFDFFSTRCVRAELQALNDRIRELTGSPTHWFRPPYGVTNPMIGRAVRGLSMKTLGWSLRSLDTVHADPERLLRRIERRLRPGCIVLLHDDRALTVAVLPRLLDLLEREGYVCVLPE